MIINKDLIITEYYKWLRKENINQKRDLEIEIYQNHKRTKIRENHE